MLAVVQSIAQCAKDYVNRKPTWGAFAHASQTWAYEGHNPSRLMPKYIFYTMSLIKLNGILCYYCNIESEKKYMF